MSLANKFGIPESLLDASKRMLEEANEYQKKVQAHMAKKGIKSLSDMTADQKKKFFNDLDAMHTAKHEEVEQVEEELKGEMHPGAKKVLKHIKPEHHGTYKPYLKKGTYKGDYKDRAAVLSAAEKAGHVKEEFEDDQEDIELTLEDIEYIMESEDFQQLDELSKNTLKSYVKKAKESYLAHNEKQHGLENARSMLNQLSDGAPGGGKQHVRGTLPGSGTVNTERGRVGEKLKKYMPDVHKQMVKIHKKLQADRIETKRVMNKRSEGIRGAEKRIRRMRPATYKNEQVELTQEDLDFIASLNQIEEGSGPKEKQKTPYRNINSPASRAAADKRREEMDKEEKSEKGKKLLGKIAAKNEEVDLDEEQLNELSKDTVASYAGKAGRTLGGNIQALSKAKEIGQMSYPQKSADQVKTTLKKSIANRKAGLDRAEKRLSENEEFDLDDFTVEEIEEYMQTEEFSQLDELSKETLGSYVKKRSHDVATQGALTRKHAMDSEAKKKETGGYTTKAVRDLDDKANRAFMKGWKHRQNIARAVDKIVNKA